MRHLSDSLSACFALFCATSLFAEPAPGWPQFRGPAGSATGEGGGYPVEFGPTGPQLLWSTKLPAGVSSPCVIGGRIFVTAYTQEDKKLETICVDAGNGNIIWRRTAPAEEIEEVHLSSSPANATPVADDRRVYTYFGSYGLLCYDYDGEQQWELPLPMPKMVQGTGSSPILVGERVLLHRDQPNEPKLLAVNRSNGKVIWQYEYTFPPGLSEEGYSTPSIYKDRAIIHAHAQVLALSLDQGKLLWSVPVPTNGCSSPCIAGDMAYIAAWTNGGETDLRTPLPDFAGLVQDHDANGDGAVSENEFSEDLAFSLRPEVTDIEDSQIYLKQFFTMMDQNENGNLDEEEWSTIIKFQQGAYAEEHGLLAIRLDDANETEPRITWAENKAVPEVPSPVHVDGRVYMVKNGGIVTCLDAMTGERHYRRRLGTAGSYYASPIALENRIYVASCSGVVTVFAAGDRLNVLARNDLGEPIAATPAAVDGIIYIRTDQHLYAFGE